MSKINYERNDEEVNTDCYEVEETAINTSNIEMQLQHQVFQDEPK